MLSRMVMEQLVDRLDVAMFNAILRESAEEMPTNPLSDPIGDLRVLRIPAGKSSFGAGAQLKNTGTVSLCCQRRKAQARRIGLARSLGARRKKSVGFFKKSAHREKKI
ncbi:putative nucleoporin [Helianthus annuus]|nr:putative nucleoporin [Helianthus annuus]